MYFCGRQQQYKLHVCGGTHTHTTTSTNVYSMCKQRGRKFGVHLKTLFNLSPRDPNKIRTHEAIWTNVPTPRNVIKNEISRPENYILINSRHCCFHKLSFENFSLMPTRCLLFCSIPYNYLKIITCYVILFVLNVRRCEHRDVNDQDYGTHVARKQGNASTLMCVFHWSIQGFQTQRYPR
jgi:hypothetical protein